MNVDIGAFDLAVNVNADVQWLEPTDSVEVLNLRAQFQENLNLIAHHYQKMCAQSLAVAIKRHKMYFEIPDLNMKGMNDDELDSLKDLG